MARFAFGLAMLAGPALAGDTTYVYDVHGQVVAVTRGTGATGYIYDQAGNRTQVTAEAAAAKTVAAKSLRAAPAGPTVLPPPSIEVRSPAPPSLEAPPSGAGPVPGAPGAGPKGEALPAPLSAEPTS
ncbi:RHS repeat domain-containing protein [Caulobacter rhizosphaerae]|uniref:RHS repeat domain-containing protein n=1 Tax=Caulobacter rhizosphaerae TaxID=2010972 RepID=UPI0013D33C28|nr:RHS repeat domain-containing protein [Caulobacter rhizosphaerae]